MAMISTSVQTKSARLTYGEQLKHPSWQRKRLEALDHYGFQCNNCGAEDKTLHVHHKLYVKGRQVWEYEISELEALCDECHGIAHAVKLEINQKLAEADSYFLESVLELLKGFFEDLDQKHVPIGFKDFTCGIASGRLALFVSTNTRPDQAEEIQRLVESVGTTRLLDALRREAGVDLLEL